MRSARRHSGPCDGSLHWSHRRQERIHLVHDAHFAVGVVPITLLTELQVSMSQMTSSPIFPIALSIFVDSYVAIHH
jgi:hypothetical protein